jgi:hypothetical protein
MVYELHHRRSGAAVDATSLQEGPAPPYRPKQSRPFRWGSACAQGHVLEWYKLHKAELEETWQLAQHRLPLKHIAPLE